MRTITIKTPAIEFKMPPKVWIPIAVVLSGTLAFLYFRFKLKKQKQLAASAAAKKEAIAEEIEKEEEKPAKPVVEEEALNISEEVESFTQTALQQNVHLPALSFNNEWEVIPLLPTAEHPIHYRIFNQAGQAAVEVYLEKAEAIIWQVTAEGMPNTAVPIHDAAQLRAVIASTLQQISPLADEDK